MEKKILFVLALFFMLTGFNGENRIVEQNGVNLQEMVDNEYFGPTIHGNPVILPAEDGSEVMFKVVCKGNPIPSVAWYHGVTKLKESARIEMINSEKDGNVLTAMLIIKNPIITDTGVYKVTFKNIYGDTTANINFSFKK